MRLQGLSLPLWPHTDRLEARLLNCLDFLARKRPCEEGVPAPARFKSMEQGGRGVARVSGCQYDSLTTAAFSDT